MRPALALYVGGMGSREQNFYNALVREYGFEEAAAEIQDLYLDGKREEACRAVPDALVDLVSLVGPPEKVAERLAAYREAGVGTLLASPLAVTREQQFDQLRLLAELVS
jgi:alkanesulfonate monooxygenase SsuD/methylene tetrahydromethanopterin reductase-like flavin-dependent oxidoreductase (luciferase family)